MMTHRTPHFENFQKVRLTDKEVRNETMTTVCLGITSARLSFSSSFQTARRQRQVQGRKREETTSDNISQPP